MLQRECSFCQGFGTYTIADSECNAMRVDCDRCDGIGFVAYAGEIAKRQSRKKSMLETAISTAVGFLVSLALISVVMPAFGYRTTFSHDFWITAIFTVASLVRGYAVRRFFEAWR